MLKWLWARVGAGLVVKALTARTPRILVYHRLSRTPRARYISVDQFREQMEFLRAHDINVLPLTDVVAGLAGRRQLPRNCVALTFDDGYSDFYDHAFPVLKRLDLPATLFVPTDFVDGRVWLWPDLIRYILASTHSSMVSWIDSERRHTLPLSAPEERETAWNSIAEHCLTLGSTERRPFIVGVAEQLGVVVPEVPAAEYRPMSWDQIRHVSCNGIEIGAHSCSHPRLTLESRQRQIREIRECKARLEQMLGIPVRHFCYPHGGPFDYCPEIKALVKQAGYESAVVCFEDDHPVHDVLELRRYSIDESILGFQKSVYGWPLLRSRARRSAGTATTAAGVGR